LQHKKKGLRQVYHSNGLVNYAFKIKKYIAIDIRIASVQHKRKKNSIKLGITLWS
jgi:hypothetical protein